MDIKGLFFHTEVNGQIQFQGQILNEISKAQIEVQLYSFADGAPTDIEIWNVKDHNFAAFFRTDEDMNLSYYARTKIEKR
ncbi:protein of unknown function (plasmid) [Pseudodesulfovibrio profundus]|jgi:hypothetical protein|uniref:Uncharacterized protein n=1 Tax=Pseudodesulfovibrio profundus TaxID=57320 RepID=A0A2C8FG39_9BACT|nr:hypothetical protein [Pseudodesulfovibrio profundus]SOB62149.1 protein of unknown function [Pseudodesulfovibrio profundus]